MAVHARYTQSRECANSSAYRPPKFKGEIFAFLLTLPAFTAQLLDLDRTFDWSPRETRSRFCPNA